MTDAAEHGGASGAHDDGAQGETHGIPVGREGPEVGGLAAIVALGLAHGETDLHLEPAS